MGPVRTPPFFRELLVPKCQNSEEALIAGADMFNNPYLADPGS